MSLQYRPLRKEDIKKGAIIENRSSKIQSVIVPDDSPEMAGHFIREKDAMKYMGCYMLIADGWVHTKYYWYNMRTEAAGIVFYQEGVVDEHPFRLRFDMNKMSKEKWLERQGKCHGPEGLKPPGHYLHDWKEITEEEYRMYKDYEKVEQEVNATV